MTDREKIHAAIGRAIEYAAENLPEGAEISIEIERGSASVYWSRDRYCEDDRRLLDSGEDLSDQINEAIEYATGALRLGESQ